MRSPSNRWQHHHIYFYHPQFELNWVTYILKCSVDCLRDAPDVLVAVFLRILWKQQLTKLSDCSVYFHNSSRRMSATLKPPRLQRRNIMVFFQNMSGFQIAPWRGVLHDRPPPQKKGCAHLYPHTDLYILHLLEKSAECLKLGCNHADRCNRRIRSYCGSVSSVRRAPLTGIHRYLKGANRKFRFD